MNCIKISRIWNCVHVPGRCSCDKTRLMSRLGAPPIRFAVCVWWFVCFFAICLVRRINYPDLFSWHCASVFFLLFLGSFLHHIFCFKHASCARIDNIISVFGSKVSVASFASHWHQPAQGLCLELPISVRNVSEREIECSSGCHFQHFSSSSKEFNHTFDRTFHDISFFSFPRSFQKQTTNSRRMFKLHRFSIWWYREKKSHRK